MKNLIVTLLIVFGCLLKTNAQEFQSFKVSFGLGYANDIYQDSDQSVGMNFIFEPAYRINDDLAIGFRFGFADTEVDIYGGDPIGSYTLNGQYYFGESKFRPFAGAGFGLYVPYMTHGEFGFYPRIGFELNHFFLMMEYNAVSRSSSSNGYSSENGFLALTIGLFAGGGRKSS